jgi:hypothetical protein
VKDFFDLCLRPQSTHYSRESSMQKNAAASRALKTGSTASRRAILILIMQAAALAAGSLLFRPASLHAQETWYPRLDTFARGTDGALWHRWVEHDIWSNWVSEGGYLDSAPTAMARATTENRIDGFYTSGGDLWWFYLIFKTGELTHVNLGRPSGKVVDPGCGGFLGFCSSGPLTSAPAVASWGLGRMDVFVFADEHHLVHRWFDNYQWSDWELLSVADFAGDPVAVSWGRGRIDVFVHGSDDNHVYQKTFDQGRWFQWQDLQGTLLYSPAVASWGPGRLDLFAVGTDRQLWTKWYSYGQWSGAGTSWDGWAPLAGTHTSSPSASSYGTGLLDVGARGTDNQLWLKRFDGSRWSGAGTTWDGWGGLGGTITSAPAVVDSWTIY